MRMDCKTCRSCLRDQWWLVDGRQFADEAKATAYASQRAGETEEKISMWRWYTDLHPALKETGMAEEREPPTGLAAAACDHQWVPSGRGWHCVACDSKADVPWWWCNNCGVKVMQGDGHACPSFALSEPSPVGRLEERKVAALETLARFAGRLDKTLDAILHATP